MINLVLSSAVVKTFDDAKHRKTECSACSSRFGCISVNAYGSGVNMHSYTYIITHTCVYICVCVRVRDPQNPTNAVAAGQSSPNRCSHGQAPRPRLERCDRLPGPR